MRAHTHTYVLTPGQKQFQETTNSKICIKCVASTHLMNANFRIPKSLITQTHRFYSLKIAAKVAMYIVKVYLSIGIAVTICRLVFS